MTFAMTQARLYTRLATDGVDLERAQRLRFDVFYRERGRMAQAPASGRDADAYDGISDHLLVFRQERPDAPSTDDELVGTYRLLRQEVAQMHGGFYSEQEFDLAGLMARKPELKFLELGHSCVKAQHRGMAAIALLWQGIWDYVREHGIDVMIGCASLDGADPGAHAATLQFLAVHAKAPDEWHVAVHPQHRVDMTAREPSPDPRKVLRSLPPLVKGYLGLGCYVGDGAYLDRPFDTVDVLIILPVARINPRYFARFGSPISG